MVRLRFLFRLFDRGRCEQITDIDSCTLMGLCTSYAGLLVARAALGLAEGGLFPGINFFITVSGQCSSSTLIPRYPETWYLVLTAVLRYLDVVQAPRMRPTHGNLL